MGGSPTSDTSQSDHILAAELRKSPLWCRAGNKPCLVVQKGQCAFNPSFPCWPPKFREGNVVCHLFVPNAWLCHLLVPDAPRLDHSWAFRRTPCRQTQTRALRSGRSQNGRRCHRLVGAYIVCVSNVSGNYITNQCVERSSAESPICFSETPRKSILTMVSVCHAPGVSIC